MKTLRKFLLLAFTICSVLSGYAQEAGFYAGVKAGMQPIGEQSFDHTENVTSDTRTVNVGGQGAVGFGLIVGSGRFFVEGGGNYGFIPVQKNDVNGNNNTGAGTVTVGYLFQLK